MSNQIKILSTKSLTREQMDMLDSSKFDLKTFDFIDIRPIEFDQELLACSPKNWIITSKNTLTILFNKYTAEELNTINFYCVGDKTSKLIIDKGYNLVDSELSSKQLGERLVNNHSDLSFCFIGGNIRRSELPEQLTNHQMNCLEFIIYDTLLTPTEVHDNFEGLLFFSPSGIHSFLKKNKINKQQLFCIGHTTATEAKKHSNNISIAANQTFEAVLELTKEHYK